MIPMMAGPPYAVAPTLRKPTAISFHVFASGSAIELHLRATSRGAGLLVHDDRRGDVLQRGPGAVEDRDFLATGPTGPAPPDDVDWLGVALLARHQAARQHMVELADLRTLIEHIDDHGGAGHQSRLELLLGRTVRAHRGDEGPGRHIGCRHVSPK